jgi:oxygen-independent coproporphyrinogen-3 oxidase
LLAGIRARVAVAPTAEITLEANPGTVDLERFAGFREAGVTRLSIGIQSFEETKLRALGRIHGTDEALRAAEAVRAAGFRNFNLDLMYGLPDQTVEQALADVETALRFGPTHLSAYQLTIEPNTYFHAHPPALPDDEAIATMHEAIEGRLAEAGLRHYEVSAYARPGFECRHNLNYWEFGDYLGIGAGAHAKITGADGTWRYAKLRHPAAYMRHAGTASSRESARRIDESDLVFEFMLNALRLHAGFAPALFVERTGLAFDRLNRALDAGRRRGLVEPGTGRVAPSELGRRFLNELLLLFVPEGTSGAASPVI